MLVLEKKNEKSSGKQLANSVGFELIQIKRDLGVEMQKLLKFLQLVQGTYREEDGMMMFTNDEHVDRYNAHVLRIIELSKDEELNLEK